MPFKDKDRKLAYQREWYAAHRQKVIADVKRRKHTLYSGVCSHCGGPTVGSSKNDIPSFCAKPICASVQRRGPLEKPDGS